MISAKEVYQIITSRLGTATSALAGHLPPQIVKDMDRLESELLEVESGSRRNLTVPSFVGLGYAERERVIRDAIRGLYAYRVAGYSQADEYIKRLKAHLR